MENNNDKKILNVPALRFPEFSGEWEKHSLGEIGETIIGLTYKPSDVVENKGTIVFRSSNIQNGAIDYSDLVRVNKTIKTRMITKVNDILVCARNGSQRLIGKNAIIKQGDTNNTFGAFMMVYRSEDNQFIFPLLSTKRYISQVGENLGARINQITTSDFNGFEFYFPTNHKERTKISELFRLLDERIAAQNKIIEDLKKLKSAISHILFSSKGAIHLSEIANVVMGQSPSSNAYNDQGLGMPLVQGNLDISNGKTTPRLYTAEFNQTTEKGNIILTVRAPVGEVAKATQKVCLGRGVCAIIPHEENMSDFIYQYLTFYKFMWRRYEQGSTFTSINGSDVRNIFCPKVRNVSILTLLDIKINIEERVVKQYQSQKQYMLYQMFI